MVPPAALARFRLTEWYDPALDPRPAPWVPYRTAEDRWVYHGIQAHHRWSAAREVWRNAATG